MCDVGRALYLRTVRMRQFSQPMSSCAGQRIWLMSPDTRHSTFSMDTLERVGHKSGLRHQPCFRGEMVRKQSFLHCTNSPESMHQAGLVLKIPLSN